MNKQSPANIQSIKEELTIKGYKDMVYVDRNATNPITLKGSSLDPKQFETVFNNYNKVITAENIEDCYNEKEDKCDSSMRKACIGTLTKVIGNSGPHNSELKALLEGIKKKLIEYNHSVLPRKFLDHIENLNKNVGGAQKNTRKKAPVSSPRKKAPVSSPRKKA
jgi:hypothetical protein